VKFAYEGLGGEGVKKNPEEIWPYFFGFIFNSFSILMPTFSFLFLSNLLVEENVFPFFSFLGWFSFFLSFLGFETQERKKVKKHPKKERKKEKKFLNY